LSTTSSSYKLSVSGAIKQFGTGLNVVGSPTLFLHNTTASTGRQYGINASNGGLFQIFDVNASNAIRFAIDKSGNVGIGNLTPASRLDVNGGGRFNSTLILQVPDIDPAAVPSAYVHSPSIAALRLGTVDVSISSINKPLISLGRHLGSGVMLYDNFGTTNDCYGIGMIPYAMQSYIPGGYSTYFTWTVGGYQTALGTGELMRLKNNGNLMLGSTDDNGSKLQVNGNISSTGFILSTGAAVGKVLTSDANGVATWQAASGSSGSWTPSGANLVNANAGLVIIGGNANPSPTDATLKLAVNGAGYMKKLKITQTGWADYVFDTSYQLRHITDVAKFIKINKRLPELPSANEVERNGIDVGDNQVLLLKKIEELTLYLIKEHEEVEKLKEQNKQILRVLANSAGIAR
jgi:hypothetical protein